MKEDDFSPHHAGHDSQHPTADDGHPGEGDPHPQPTHHEEKQHHPAQPIDQQKDEVFAMKKNYSKKVAGFIIAAGVLLFGGPQNGYASTPYKAAYPFTTVPVVSVPPAPSMPVGNPKFSNPYNPLVPQEPVFKIPADDPFGDPIAFQLPTPTKAPGITPCELGGANDFPAPPERVPVPSEGTPEPPNQSGPDSFEFF